jgi:cobalt/nickel transport system permease protein
VHTNHARFKWSRGDRDEIAAPGRTTPYHQNAPQAKFEGLLPVTLLVPPLPWCIVIALLVSLAATLGAKIPASIWLGVLSVPVSFAFPTTLGISVQINKSGGGFGLGFDWRGLSFAGELLLRSVAAISCLAFIGWTTPLMELIPVFQRMGIRHGID